MVLKKIINNSGKDINFPWGPWNHCIPSGGELINPPSDVLKAMLDRYKGIEVVVIDEPIIEETSSAEMPVEDIQSPEDPALKKKPGRPKKVVA